MLRVLGIVGILVLVFYGSRPWFKSTDAYSAAQTFAANAPDVVQAAGKGAKVVHMMDSTRSYNPEGKECAAYRMLLRGDIGEQWVVLEVYRPAKKAPWELVRLEKGKNGVAERCTLR